MIIEGTDIGKKYGKSWIFRHLDFELNSGEMVGITGKNGAGKSTLLQLIAGFFTPSQGTITMNDLPIEEANVATVFVGPYTEVIEEFSLKEFLDFHSKFKKATVSIEEMAQRASLPLDKRISDFSTGMKQRTKLITAFFFENDLFCLDEPTANLDEEGFHWWKKEVQNLQNGLVLIASNDSREIDVTQKRLNL